MSELSTLGKQGIVLMSGNYQAQTEYIYTQLNDIKPEMIEEAHAMPAKPRQSLQKTLKARWGKFVEPHKGNSVSIHVTEITRIL